MAVGLFSLKGAFPELFTVVAGPDTTSQTLINTVSTAEGLFQ